MDGKCSRCTRKVNYLSVPLQWGVARWLWEWCGAGVAGVWGVLRHPLRRGASPLAPSNFNLRTIISFEAGSTRWPSEGEWRRMRVWRGSTRIASGTRTSPRRCSRDVGISTKIKVTSGEHERPFHMLVSSVRLSPWVRTYRNSKSRCKTTKLRCIFEYYQSEVIIWEPKPFFLCQTLSTTVLREMRYLYKPRRHESKVHLYCYTYNKTTVLYKKGVIPSTLKIAPAQGLEIRHSKISGECSLGIYNLSFLRLQSN